MHPKIRSALHAIGLHVSSASKHKAQQNELEESRRKAAEGEAFRDFLLANLNGTSGGWQSQASQDVFALVANGFKRGGYFVEFGATNGKSISNTYVLEKEFGWTGIVAEPAKCWHEDLRRNRSCEVEYDCVWKETGAELEFKETGAAELSTISDFSEADLHSRSRRKAVSYTVKTVSLLDMLARHGAPREIDFLSVDTEGSELDILQAFDFSKHRFNAITVEHNYTEQRAAIRALLEQNGYRNVAAGASGYDDWFVPDDSPVKAG